MDLSTYSDQQKKDLASEFQSILNRNFNYRIFCSILFWPCVINIQTFLCGLFGFPEKALLNGIYLFSSTFFISYSVISITVINSYLKSYIGFKLNTELLENVMTDHSLDYDEMYNLLEKYGEQ